MFKKLAIAALTSLTLLWPIQAHPQTQPQEQNVTCLVTERDYIQDNKDVFSLDGVLKGPALEQAIDYFRWVFQTEFGEDSVVPDIDTAYLWSYKGEIEGIPPFYAAVGNEGCVIGYFPISIEDFIRLIFIDLQHPEDQEQDELIANEA